jgi:hypothetical protein
MNISAKLGMISSAVFVAVCLAFAIPGFMSLGAITDPTQLADAKGYAWYWTFLAGVAAVFGVVSWRIDWTQRDHRDE